MIGNNRVQPNGNAVDTERVYWNGGKPNMSLQLSPLVRL